MASFRNSREKLTVQGQSSICRPQATESDNSGVTQTQVTASRSAETNKQHHDYDRA